MQSSNQGRQTELVKRALICRISDLKLKTGDKLPAQAELRNELGVGNVTITRALEALAADGIVEIRPKRGVFLKTAAVNGYIGRNIALISLRLQYSPASASSLQCLQTQLRDHACQCVAFQRNISRMYDQDKLDYFDGLERCVRQRRLDGVLATVSFEPEALAVFEECAVPVVTVLGGRNAGAGVVLDQPGMVSDMLAQAFSDGFRRPALLSCGYPITAALRNAFVHGAAPECGSVWAAENCRILFPEMRRDEAPDELFQQTELYFREFIARPGTERPDAVLIPDDILAGHFYTLIYRALAVGSCWKPKLYYFANKQLPIFYPDPADAVRFENDQMEAARTAVELLLKIIQNGPRESHSIMYKPRLIKEPMAK